MGGGGGGGSGGGGKQIRLWEEKPVPLAGRSNLKLNRGDNGRRRRIGGGEGVFECGELWEVWGF